MQREFPEIKWSGLFVRFTAECSMDTLPTEVPIYASLVFAFEAGALLLANIPGRGWTIPGGRIEAGETPFEAASREVFEETGACLEDLELMGWYRLESLEPSALNSPVRCVPVFAARVSAREEIPGGSESRGIRTSTFADLPQVYYTWDPLIEAVCTYAFDFAGERGWAPPRS
jgi:8-oxo-dGTP diphosphatase